RARGPQRHGQDQNSVPARRARPPGPPTHARGPRLPGRRQHPREGAERKIGIVGAGNIGKTLSRKLSAAGHDVKIANSRGPETIDPEALSTGARAVDAADAVRDVEFVILSIPLNRMPAFASTLSAAPADAVVID